MMNEKTINQNDDVIDLSILFVLLRKNLILLIVVTILFGAASYGITKFFIPEKYQASATLIVNNKSDNSYVNQSEIVAAQNLADLYSIIITSEPVLQEVIDNLGLEITYEQLKGSISVQAVNSTQVIEISMISTDAKYAKKIVAEIVEVSKPVILDKVEAGSVKDLSEASVSNNGNPISPNKKKNSLLGAIAGFILVYAVLFLKELFNNKIKSENDLVNTLGVPLLGVIPAVDGKDFNKK